MLDFGFLLSVAFAHAATNLDNLALLFVLTSSLGRTKALAGFFLAQALVLSAAMALGGGAEALIGGHARWLGVVPVGLGLLALRQTGDTEARLTGSAGVLAVMTLFVGLSFDTLAVLAPIFADSTLRFDLDALAGAGLSALALGGAVFAASGTAMRSLPQVDRLKRIAPFVMIAAGIYVLMDTGTDLP